MLKARWDLLPADRYMWASVQTVRGCPEALFVLLGVADRRTEAARPRERCGDRRDRRTAAQRFSLHRARGRQLLSGGVRDLRMADRRADKSQLERLKAIRGERFELMERLAKLPKDMVFFTQITMEAAEDPKFLDAMRKANIKGALVGVESVTPEGLKDVYKDFNFAGDELAARLQTFRRHGVHVLGSFIFGLPSDRPETFEATAEMAQRAGVTFAQFVMLTPFPGTIDFERWEEKMAQENIRIARHPDHAPLADPAGAAAEGVFAASGDAARRNPGAHASRVGSVLQLAEHLGALVLREEPQGTAWRLC